MPSGIVAAQLLETERDNLLRSHPWNFAMTRAQLSKLAVTPEFEWKYAYALPSDFLRLVSAHDNDAGGGQLRYKIENIDDGGTWKAAVMTDAEDVYIRYVRLVTNLEAKMLSSFRHVLTLRLAKTLATALPAVRVAQLQILDEELRMAMRQARSVDGIEDYPEQIPEGSWAQSRRGNAWGRGSTWASG